MIINANEARIEWASRVARQCEEMLIIAAATNNDEMRDEFLCCARRLAAKFQRIQALAA